MMTGTGYHRADMKSVQMATCIGLETPSFWTAITGVRNSMLSAISEPAPQGTPEGGRPELNALPAVYTTERHWRG